VHTALWFRDDVVALDAVVVVVEVEVVAVIVVEMVTVDVLWLEPSVVEDWLDRVDVVDAVDVED